MNKNIYQNIKKTDYDCLVVKATTTVIITKSIVTFNFIEYLYF